MTLKYPYLLLLLLIYIPLIWYWVATRKSRSASLSVSSLAALSNLRGKGGRAFLFPVCRFLELAAIGFLIVALARPQEHDKITSSSTYGTDIVLALDISESMLSTDISPSRFEAAKATALDFIDGRKNDNMGLVIFSEDAVSIMPLTNDLLALRNAVKSIRIGSLGTMTAIGDGLVSAINRVKNGPATSKSIILLTDGTNNSGDVSPQIAAEIAASDSIKAKVYTIGIGLDGEAVISDPYGYRTTVMNTPIDEETLRMIAAKTGGKYYRVTSANMLSQVFREIDSLEKSQIDVKSYKRTEEAFMPWVLAALCCYAFVLLLRFTILNKLP